MAKLIPPCKPKDLCWVFYKDHHEDSTAFTDSGPPQITINCCIGWIREWPESVEVIYEQGSTQQITRTVVLRGDLIEIRPVIKPRRQKEK